ncbi:Uncharacterised protein [Mycobacteroides abscessus subsp. massiliense]|nr:Uncharacterised protein [Mycobacteroides abscessus subsp. massiliense]
MRSVSTKDKCPASIAQSTPAGQFRAVFITHSGIGLVFLLGSLTVQLAPLRQELDGNGIEQGFTLIFICRQQRGQFLLAVRIVQGNRCREITQQRRDNRLIDATQHKSLLGFSQYQNRLFHTFALIFKLNRFAFFV